MARVIVIGGGPAGLSAALITQKNGLETTVFDTGATWMENAHLFNYLGIGSQQGSAFMNTSRRQVSSFWVDLRENEEVQIITKTNSGFAVETSEGSYNSEYIVLATGANRDLAHSLGCEFDDDVVAVDVVLETSIPNVYATGAMVRVEEWQAIISAGDGAAAALNILSKEKGKHFHDFDVPADAHEVFGVIAEEA